MTPALRDAYARCRAVTRERAENFYYTFLLLPRQRREALFALYAFTRRCDDIADEPGAIADKLRDLGKCRSRLDAAARGDPPTDDFVFLALGDTLTRFSIPAGLAGELIDGMAQDLSVTRYETFEALKRYCYKAASVVGLMCLPVFGCRDERARAHAVDLGLAMQLVNIVRDVKEDLARNRIYIPQEDLAATGCSEESLQRGDTNEAFRRLVALEARRARECFASGRQLLPLIPRSSRFCPAALAAVYGRILDKIERDPARVMRERVRISAGGKLALAAKALVQSWLTPSLR
ncbi:MAG: phytoene/squalene synthase family protein [Planctomycetota bacterium]